VREFIGEEVQVEFRQEVGRKVPVSWFRHGRRYDVERILASWEDHGFGSGGPAQKRWWQRRHRSYFLVASTEGEVYELYWDRKSPSRPWVLSKRGK